MIDLAQRSEPYEIALPYGLSVTVKPLTTAGMAAAQAAARRLVEAIERQARERSEAGLPLDGLPDLSDEGERDGFYQAQLIRELAVRHITGWTGVELSCVRGQPGADGRLCPYREHALITRQEHEAWEVLLACQGQLRLAPSGHVIGIDMDAALKIGAARGCDLAVLSELLPAAEAGLVEALCAEKGRPF